MCAPHELVMEEPTISRFNSQSTSRTLVDGIDGIASPILSPIDASSGQIPMVHTPDSKQWIDLEYLSPKILKELRRQYDREPNSTLAKGAAKVKAWARQSKLGIEIRLRRKINAEHDEVTDIHLVPDDPTPDYEQRDEKLPMISELPGAPNQVIPELPGGRSTDISELPDSSITSELDNTSVPSRTSTGSAEGEPLPRYEPRQYNNGQPATVETRNERSGSLGHLPQTAHHHSSSQDSIIATPTRGLSLVDLPAGGDKGGLSLTEAANEEGDGRSASDHKRVEDGNLEAPITKLESTSQFNEERELARRLQDIIEALQQEHLKRQGSTAGTTTQRSPTLISKDASSHLKIANRETYEIETDAEIPSPSPRKPAKIPRKKSVTLPKRKKSASVAKTPTSFHRKTSIGSDDEPTVNGTSLLRKQTIPKRLPASAGAEAIWASLLHMQAKILGPEHPLTYLAKSDLAHSRANGHVKGFEDLATLRKSRNLATQTLGIVHPWVAAFSEDLNTLERLTGFQISNGSENDDQKAQADATVNSPIDSVRRSKLNSVDNEQETNLTSEPQPSEPTSSAVSSTSGDIKPSVPRIVTSLVQSEHDTLKDTQSVIEPSNLDRLWNSWQPPHKPRSRSTLLPGLVFGAVMNVALNSILWLQHNYGPEQPVELGKVRVKWTCSCGQEMHDDFIERRQGAARELEAYLNRPKTLTGGAGTPASPASSSGSRSFTNSSLGGPPSSQTSLSNYSFQSSGSMGRWGDTKAPQNSTGVSAYPPYSPLAEPPWLLTCANEDRYTPKLAHLDMAPHKIRSDKDLALSLREHYFHVNKKWWRSMRLRGLTTIEFVQFEVHQNRFADIRKCPDMPPLTTGDYSFEAGDLLPPVGSHYLLHLFKHPEDYDGELITYLRAPKRNGRLQLGQGWGINLVEGFLADKVWMVLSVFFALGSLAFFIVWECEKHDVQGASGVAAWMVGLVLLVFGWLQAFLG